MDYILPENSHYADRLIFAAAFILLLAWDNLFQFIIVNGQI